MITAIFKPIWRIMLIQLKEFLNVHQSMEMKYKTIMKTTQVILCQHSRWIVITTTSMFLNHLTPFSYVPMVTNCQILEMKRPIYTSSKSTACITNTMNCLVVYVMFVGALGIDSIFISTVTLPALTTRFSCSK